MCECEADCASCCGASNEIKNAFPFVLMISCSLLAGAAVDESDPLCLLSDEATIKLAHDIAAIDDDIPVLQVC